MVEDVSTIEVAIDQEPPTVNGVKNKWFNGFQDGNRIFPNTTREGIGPLVTNAVLNDPPDSWEDFWESRLSDGQVDKLGNAMNGFHGKADVLYSTKPLVPPDAPLRTRFLSGLKGDRQFFIRPDRLQTLWTITTEHVALMVLGYQDRQYRSNNDLLPSEKQRVEDFLTKPEFAEDAATFKEIVSIAARSITDETGTEISNRYKKNLIAGTEKGKQEGLLAIRAHVTEAVQEQFPNEDLEWLYPPLD